MARSQRRIVRHYPLEKSVPTPDVLSRNTNTSFCAAQRFARPKTQCYGRNAPEGQVDFRLISTTFPKLSPGYLSKSYMYLRERNVLSQA